MQIEDISWLEVLQHIYVNCMERSLNIDFHMIIIKMKDVHFRRWQTTKIQSWNHVFIIKMEYIPIKWNRAWKCWNIIDWTKVWLISFNVCFVFHTLQLSSALNQLSFTCGCLTPRLKQSTVKELDNDYRLRADLVLNQRASCSEFIWLMWLLSKNPTLTLCPVYETIYCLVFLDMVMIQLFNR